MPVTRNFGGGWTRRAARWLAAALLAPALAACGGGGGSDSGQADNGQSSGPQPDDRRTKAREIQGSFQNAGAVSASARGSGTKAVVMLKSSSPTPAEAVISNVTDCTDNATPATPSEATVTVTDAGSEPVEFTLPTSSGTTRPVCYTVTIDGESQDLQATGAVAGTADTGTPGTGGTGPSGGSTSPGGGATSYESSGGTDTESGSAP
ncbi:hypothetical protein BX285_3793 [Streptomyces sp. 1114.5]|uniref:hypothetical protein n=1 Tax=unclassified Streptomyces TaxID=2593676 RepID=UPI000BCF09D0|nr:MULTISPECIES: hypothetical protein [unclassified Streptomyces]RKT19337.1 hypothetical protein BX285_3793 [Streptomyces sp. 1114.5]SOB85534.1 hypothetical protein SAMN06272789_5822 [Streptomyces sp. 1331.2]